MQIFIMMIGLPGSGKSTLADELAIQLDGCVFSSDEYRKKLLGDRRDQNNNTLIFNTLYKDMKQALLKGKSCIFDATNISMKSRRQAMDMIQCLPNRKNIHTKAVVVNVPIEECYKRDAQREYSVGKKVIDKFYYKFQMPIFEEGFDSISYSQDVSLDIAKDWFLLKDKRQNNPYHQYTIKHHCIETAYNVSFKGFYELDPLYLAAWYHDIGKFFTETKDEEGVSHYIGHDSVGVYKIITEYPVLGNIIGGDCLDNYEVDFLFYINWHMNAHRWTQEKTINKYKRLFGEEKVNNLLLLAECDDLARGDEEFRKRTNKENCYR